MMIVIWILVSYAIGVLWFYATEWAFIRRVWVTGGPSRLKALRFAMRWPYELVSDPEYVRGNLTANFGFRL